LFLLCHIVLLLLLVFSDHLCRKKSISLLAHPIHVAISVPSDPSLDRAVLLDHLLRREPSLVDSPQLDTSQFHSFLASVEAHRQYRFRLG